MTNKNKTGVTVIGLGDMGGALAEALLKKDYSLTVWNRNAEKTKRLITHGASTLPTLSEAVANNPISIMCVSDHASSMKILNTPDVKIALKGNTLVQLSTITSSESREMGKWLDTCDAKYLDGQILSYPSDVLESRASVVCSGPRALFEEYEVLLSDMSGNVKHVGEKIGAAPTFDKAHLSWAMGNYLVFLQSAAMCATAGVDLRAWCDFNLQNVAEGNLQRELEILATQVCNRNYEEGLEATMEVWLNAINKTVEECKALGVDPVHLTRLRELANTAVSSGNGQKELGALFEQLIVTNT